MNPTWSEYQKALQTVKDFETNKDKVRAERRPWRLSSKERLWDMINELSKMQYDIRSYTYKADEQWVADYHEKVLAEHTERLLKTRFALKELFN